MSIDPPTIEGLLEALLDTQRDMTAALERIAAALKKQVEREREYGTITAFAKAAAIAEVHAGVFNRWGNFGAATRAILEELYRSFPNDPRVAAELRARGL